MSSYVKNFIETFNFDGDTVTVTLKQLKRVHAVELLPFVKVMGKIAVASKAGEEGGAQQMLDALSEEVINKSQEFTGTAAKIIKEGEYVVNMDGLTIEGREVKPNTPDFETVLSDFYFTAVVATIAGLLIKNSSMVKEDEKKLEEQSNTTTSKVG